jgi:hypothetical protein
MSARLNLIEFGPVFAALLADERLNPLGPGQPNLGIRRTLETLNLIDAFAPQAIRAEDMAKACLAGLWLRHDFLDESHTFSQSLESPTGSYWHGLMHRREPDFDNASYWFRQVGRHPIFPALVVAAAEVAAQADPTPAACFLQNQIAWDPFAFIDLCRECIGRATAQEELCRRVQQREWELLFEYCHRQALAG